MNPFHRRERTRLTDRDIALLISRSPDAPDEHADLQWFLTALADQRSVAPLDTEGMATALASIARSSRPAGHRPARPRRAARRMVAVAASFALLFAMSGIALAADDAAPGDFLYGLDRAFELIGIGDGGVEERMAEFDALIDREDDETAYELLEGVIESSSEGEAAKPQALLDIEAGDASTGEHRQLIEENEKDGVGADGKDFGQGVAGIVSRGEIGPPEQTQGKKPDTPVGDNEDGSGNQGRQTNQSQGPPPDVDNKGNGDTGRPDDAGKKDK